MTKFFAEALFRTSALECLTEIAGLVDLDPRYNPLQQQMFVVLVKQVSFFFMKVSSVALFWALGCALAAYSKALVFTILHGDVRTVGSSSTLLLASNRATAAFPRCGAELLPVA